MSSAVENIPVAPYAAKRLGSARRAAALSEKTGTHHTGTDSDDAKGDEEATRVVAIAVRSSSAVIVTGSAA